MMIYFHIINKYRKLDKEAKSLVHNVKKYKTMIFIE